MSYTETIYPPASSAEHALILCNNGCYLELKKGPYTAMYRPIGVMKKPYNRSWA